MFLNCLAIALADREKVGKRVENFRVLSSPIRPASSKTWSFIAFSASLYFSRAYTTSPLERRSSASANKTSEAVRSYP
uniref:Uncharacterized protein n=1 Tax=Candidatus Aramenus sulfurataquae TaxID=1326980 RepID=A0A0F2LNA8_9CREN